MNVDVDFCWFVLTLKGLVVIFTASFHKHYLREG